MPLVHILLVLTVVEKAFIRLLSDWSLNHTGLNQSCATLATLFSFLFVLLSAWVRRNLELWIETQESRVEVTGHGSLAAGSTFDGVISSRAHIPRVFAQCPVGLAAGHCRVRRTLSSWYFCLWMFVCFFCTGWGHPLKERKRRWLALSPMWRLSYPVFLCPLIEMWICLIIGQCICWRWRGFDVSPWALVQALQFTGVWWTALHDSPRLHWVRHYERTKEWVAQTVNNPS